MRQTSVRFICMVCCCLLSLARVVSPRFLSSRDEDRVVNRFTEADDDDDDEDSGWRPEQLIPGNYNKMKAPVDNGSPALVSVSLKVTQIPEVNEADQSYHMRCIVTQVWRDKRIVFPEQESSPRIFLTPGIVKSLWIPNTFFGNSFNLIHPAFAPVVSYELTRDQVITLHARMSLKLNCDFDLSFFPHDTQDCDVVIESETHTKASVNYSWSSLSIAHDPSSRFQVESLREKDCENSRGHEFSCLKAVFTLRRRLTYYVIRIYGPSVLVVLMTFIGFWMPIQWLPARTNVLVLPLLTLVTQQSQVNGEIAVSYVVALHIWFAVCIFFIFMALIELATALLYAQRVSDWKDQEQEEQEARDHKLLEEAAARIEKELAQSSGRSSGHFSAGSDAESGDQFNHSHTHNGRNHHSPHHTIHPMHPHNHHHPHHNKERRPSGLSVKHSDSAPTAGLAPHLLRVPTRLQEKRASVISLGSAKVSRSSSHLIKLLLTRVYGHVDWRKAPRERNKIDYVARILFPSLFALFVTIYFSLLLA